MRNNRNLVVAAIAIVAIVAVATGIFRRKARDTGEPVPAE